MTDLRKAAEEALKTMENEQRVDSYGITGLLEEATEHLRAALSQPSIKDTRDEEIALLREEINRLRFCIPEGDAAAAMEYLAYCVEQAVAAEREACAKVCRSEANRALWNFQNDLPRNNEFWNGAEQMASNCENLIKTRLSATTDPSDDMIGKYWQPFYTTSQSNNDFKPDWDTVKAYDDKFSEMLGALESCEAFLLSAGFASTDLYAEVCAAIGKVTEDKK